DRFTVLPMRFSTLFSGKEDMLLKVKDHYDDFIENLDRVRDKCEFGIKVIWPGNIIKERIINTYKNENPSHLEQSGTKFMEEKFEKYKIDKEFEEEADRCIGIVDSFFNRLASEKKLEKLKTDNLLLSASYLVDKEKKDDFKKAFEELRSSGGDLKYLVSGPWPPYNFIILTHSEDRKFGSLDMVETILQYKNSKKKDSK
ncbi:MAG: GvpL/GvpF family gas vesicle protein, partial [candidate division Zixibacteria bacterium]|nr:GvpL/GvpF family gas vesicle protein [candidate division Zixibacteria bacterium]